MLLYVSLSSIAFNSLQNALASAYEQNATPSRTASQVSARGAAASNVVSIRSARSAYPGASTVLARDLTGLLQGLASGDVDASKSALATFSLHLGAHDNDDGSGSGLAALLTRVSSRLDSGATVAALGDVQTFLLSSGQVRGTGFSATV
jgi:hypothetical protein